MTWYCEKCKKLHTDEEMCPRIMTQLKKNPQLLIDAANYTTIAGQYELVTSNALDNIAQQVNKLVGTNISYEGTQQFARDVQVFKRLNEEAFVNCKAFSSPEVVQKYLKEATKGKIDCLIKKLTGSGQEVDWIRYKESQLSSLFEKSELLNKNAAGVDGVTINRFTGKTISRTTVKASKNVITKNSTAIKDVKEAIEKGTANKNDILFATEGAKDAAQKAGLSNAVIEKNTSAQVQVSNERLLKKIRVGEATTQITPEQLGNKMCQGAVIGAAVGLTLSAITSYIRYYNGELTQQEAFSQVTEDTLKSAIIGAGTSAITLFIPGGTVGVIGGMIVGIYLNSTCTNILDEIFGKGAYGAILNASGYIYGMTTNLETAVTSIATSMNEMQIHLRNANEIQKRVDLNLSKFSKELEELI